MSIRRIEVRNFKSFDHLVVDLGDFNLVIGANASGKSNFVRIFEFLRDIENFGLDNAISMQGGVEYLRNMRIGSSKPLAIKVVFDDQYTWATRTTEGILRVEIHETAYEFSLRFQTKGFIIEKDELRLKFKLEKSKGKTKEKEAFGEGEIVVHRKDGKPNIEVHRPGGISIDKGDLFPPLWEEVKLPDDVLLLETPFLFVPLSPRSIKFIVSKISIYDFDPKLPKKASPITGKAELEGDGSNLSIILKNITENEESRKKLLNLVRDLLPFVENLDVEKFADKTLLFKLKESYFKDQDLPASLISDGTINIIALIIALYFEKKPLIIIEEPERNIHPSLIAKVIAMMKDASQTQKKQIIVTTHNPELVKHAGLENILLVSRNADGFSFVSKPADKKEIKLFLQNDIGIEDLFINRLLEV